MVTLITVVVANAQTVDITVNPGTSGNIVVGQDVYHIDEMIYLNSEVGASNFTSAGTQIQQVGFYATEGYLGDTTAPITPYKIYMKNVASGTTTMAAGNYSTTGYTLVYNGAFNPTQSGWYTLPLTTPFTRTANSNLGVLIVRNNGAANPGYVFNASVGNANNSAASTLRRYNGATQSVACTTSIYRPAIRLRHVYAVDAGFGGLINPTSSCYGSPQDLGVVLTNDGSSTIAAGAASVVLKVRGANTYTSSATANTAAIAPGGYEIIPFTGINLNNPGTNYDTALVTLSGDGSRLNDTLKATTPTSRVINYSEFPMLESADDSLPIFRYLQESDASDGSGQFWSLSGNYANTDQLDTLYPLSGARFFIYYAYNAPAGNISRLYSRCLMLPGTLAPNPAPVSTVSFWMSHDTVYNQYLDSLYLTVSTDKGATWTRVAGFQRPDLAALAPSWTQEFVDISAYNGQIIQLGLEGVSQYGNSFGVDDIEVSYSGAAPVTLLNFDAKRNGTANNLFWNTSSEINVNKYVIERSADGKNFKQIGETKSNNNANAESNYSFKDVAPIKGYNYYRLRIVDNNNTITYSAVRVIRNVGQADMVVANNPVVTPSMKLIIDADRTERATVTISDLRGTKVYTGSVNVSAGVSTTAEVPVATLAKGTYIVTLQLNDQTIVKKVTKQ